MCDNHNPSLKVVEAVAEQKGTDPQVMLNPLYDVIDPDALNQLFTGGPGHVTFAYLDYEVTVDQKGHVEVVPLEDS